LDEPGRNQSDPTVLELQLRATTKKVQSGDVVVRSIEDASKSLSAIEKWIQNISDLHSSKPPPQVIYKHNHPDIDTLMQVWPDKFEKSLDHIPLPSPDLDVSLTEYSKILCSLLDIPVYDNPVESLYVMFSLYLEFKNHPNFQVNHGQDMSSYPFGGADVMDVDEDIRK
jgi:intraflagellar transport protein 46